MADTLGDRMKGYERSFRSVLPNRLPVILRVDGKSFHTYTKSCEKPFDDKLINAMNKCAMALCKAIHGAQMAYIQSDEISVLIHGYKRFNYQPWFGNQVQKMTSVAASIASSTMTEESIDVFGEIRKAAFDARVFVLPEADVANYFIWRQKDWERNSVQMLARSLYSHKECDHKNNLQLKGMICDLGGDWNNIPTHLKLGRCIVKMPSMLGRATWQVDNEIPAFVQCRDYIERFLLLEEG